MEPFGFRKLCYLVLAVTALSTNSCGKKSKSQEVSISVEPQSPIVFTSDATIKVGNEDKVIKAPWFAFSVRIDNHLENSSVTINSLHVEVQGFDVDGNMVTKKSDLLAGDGSFSTETQNCTYVDFGQFDANGVRLPGGPSINDELLYSIPDVSGCPIRQWTFYVTGPDPGENGILNYRVKVQPMGWFGTRKEQIDRFENYTTFSTR
jgi:hypothetical protein